MASIRNIGVLVTLLSVPQLGAGKNVELSAQYSSCMDQAGGVTVNVLACIDAETELQDERLNNAYKAAMHELAAPRRTQLQQAQRAWIAFRDENCAFYADPEGGSMARIVANDCFMSATAARADELEALSGETVVQRTAPTQRTAAPQAFAPVLTGIQNNAVRAAQAYLSFTGFSRDGLIQQLSSSAGDGFDVSDATIAVDSLNVDWNQQAVQSAKQYLQLMGFSCQGLIRQLSSPAGDKYTEEQARYGAIKAGAC